MTARRELAAHRPAACEEVACGGVGPGAEDTAARMQAGTSSALLVFDEFAATATLLRRFGPLAGHLEKQRNVAFDELLFGHGRAGVPPLVLLALPPISLPVLSMAHGTSVVGLRTARERAVLRNGFAMPPSMLSCLSAIGLLA